VSAPALSDTAHDPKVLVETSRALPLVSMTIATRAGATEDPVGKEGLLRLTSRLVRRTGAGLTTEQLDERIDTLGASLSVDVGHSAATFHGTVISRSLDAFADLLVGVLGKPSLSEAELSKLQRETLAELVEARDHDRELGQRWFRQRLFAGHPFSRPVSGTTSSIGAIIPSDARAMYDRVVSASDVVFAFAGDIDPAGARSIAERVAAALPVGSALPDTVPEPLPKVGRRLVIVDKPERTQTQILIGCLGTHPHDPDHIALHVGSTIFGGTFTARLMKEVRSKRGWSYGAYSNLPYDRHRARARPAPEVVGGRSHGQRAGLGTALPHPLACVRNRHGRQARQPGARRGAIRPSGWVPPALRRARPRGLAGAGQRRRASPHHTGRSARHRRWDGVGDTGAGTGCHRRPRRDRGDPVRHRWLRLQASGQAEGLRELCCEPRCLGAKRLLRLPDTFAGG